MPPGTASQKPPLVPPPPPPPPVPNKPNSIQVNPKPNKNIYGVANYPNRKNTKNSKPKSASRIGKLLNPAPPFSGANGTRAATTSSPKSQKTTQKHWLVNKTKNLTPKSNKGPARTTTAPPTSSLPLTIVLGPSSNLTNSQKVPDVFQKYPKIQQLFPLYVNTGRIYNEENFIPKMDFGPSKGHEYFPKSSSNQFPVVLKSERQDPYDTSSILRVNTEAKHKLTQIKKPPSRNQLNQGKPTGF